MIGVDLNISHWHKEVDRRRKKFERIIINRFGDFLEGNDIQ